MKRIHLLSQAIIVYLELDPDVVVSLQGVFTDWLRDHPIVAFGSNLLEGCSSQVLLWKLSDALFLQRDHIVEPV